MLIPDNIVDVGPKHVYATAGCEKLALDQFEKKDAAIEVKL
jgi:hypothetical protein